MLGIHSALKSWLPGSRPWDCSSLYRFSQKCFHSAAYLGWSSGLFSYISLLLAMFPSIAFSAFLNLFQLSMATTYGDTDLSFLLPPPPPRSLDLDLLLLRLLSLL